MDISNIRLFLLYEFKLGHNATAAAENINTAFGQQVAYVRTAQRWFARFRSGDMSLESQERGRPQVELNDDVMLALIDENRRITVRELSIHLQVSAATVCRHLQALKKRKKLDQWVPHNLSEFNKVTRLQTCISLLDQHIKASFLHRIVTCDEKWILYDNRKRTASWCDEDEPPQKWAKPDLHPKKVMLTVWWTAKQIIHFSFLRQGQSIDANMYCSQLEAMHQKLLEKQPSLVNRHGVVLLHDNARPHVAVQTINKIKELGYEVLSHSPYSPDLSPTDYHLFKHLQNHLRDKIFDQKCDVENDFTEFIDSCDEEFFKHGIDSLPSRWQKCIDSNGDYFD